MKASTDMAPYLSLTDQRRLQVSLPTPAEAAIAEILGSLDAKIELNRRMNETLEGMARAIFKSLVRGLRPGAGQGRRPPARRHGRRHRRIVPRPFRRFAAGRNPVGWSIGTVGDVAAINCLSIKKDYAQWSSST